MENTKDITAMEFARYKNCNVQNVRKHFANNGLEHKFFNGEVLDVKHYARFYLFVVSADMVIPD